MDGDTEKKIQAIAFIYGLEQKEDESLSDFKLRIQKHLVAIVAKSEESIFTPPTI